MDRKVIALDIGQVCVQVELVPVLDKAGAYAIQQHGDLLIDHISGDLNNIIGLPLEQLRRELSAASAL